MSAPGRVSRRDFVKAAAAVGTGLTLAVYFQGCGNGAPPAPDGVFAPDAFLRLSPDGTVTVVIGRSEMGQGPTTGLAMILADELDCDWNRVGFVQGPAAKAYYNPALQAQVTGGSTSIRTGWLPMREAGATARAMLVAAAAGRWGVPAASCSTAEGRVRNDTTGEELEYGALVADASALPVPKDVPLKDPKDFRIIGTSRDRLDNADKVRGVATFGIDVRLPGMAYASVERCPVMGGQVGRVAGEAEVAGMPGVIKVVRLKDRVAVVAEHYWQAVKGRRALNITWAEGEGAALSSDGIAEQLQALLVSDKARVARKAGDAAGILAGSTSIIEAAYDAPYLAHATMEPQNCTAWVHDGAVEVWAPTQFQMGPGFLNHGGARGVAADAAGVSTGDVTIHTTFLGGGFGRRLEVDYVTEAVQVAKELDRPVQVIWSREDDTQHDFYRPTTAHALSAVLGGDGMPVAWRQRIACQSIIRNWIPGWMPDFAMSLAGALEHGVDPSAVEGSADLPYAVPNLLVDWRELTVPVPVGFWRSVGHSQNSFVTESFVDELAAVAGQDPVAYRRALLTDEPRMRAVLDLAATEAGWGTPLPDGRARGVAIVRSFGSIVAQVAEVSITPAGIIQVHRVTCAVDCGTAVNPGLIEAQMQGGVVFGLTAALYGEITIAKGRVQQNNFYDYEMVRMPAAPVVDVHIVPSAEPPGGVGEPGVPPIAPAVANAVFALTGQRLRRLPLRLT
ncbi:MAG TPA: xanthine dehydrogenase family protein molybdopterin-binding subunit, partial [Gemmatimonadales bacterium]|nr:xanthine dehydrogenase family protein molybdopterin-binding subunit [Gemmatimonadales bacterium]